MYIRATFISVLLAATAFAQAARISVEPRKVLHRVTPRYIGVNLEDLNFQTYGGLYSQLIHGESFQENIDSAVLGLAGKDRLSVYVGENASGELELRGSRSHNAARELLGLKLVPEPASTGPGRRSAGTPVAVSELPGDKRLALLNAGSPERRVSRQWRSFENGATGTFGFERKAPFIGTQSQIVTFATGGGEVGIENAGLNRWGINLVGGNHYEGVLRVKGGGSSTVWVSLLNSTGSAKLAEKALTLTPGNEYQRIEFTLTPNSSDEKGHFAISLKAPGSITVGYAFLQPGPWGRYKDLPLRKDLAQAIVDQGVKVIRYGGSMVSGAPDYKWKNMIGPRDLRKPYQGSFNPYASHGFGIFDLLSFAEAADVLAIPSVRIDETPEDMADFVEYVNGLATSPWGKRRAADGHPEPYRLKHLEIGNEQTLDDNYCARFEILARAIWAKDPSFVLLIAHSLIAPSGQAAKVWEVGPGGELSDRLKNAVRLVRFAQQQKGQVWWDQHYQAFPNEYEWTGSSPNIDVIPTLKGTIDKLVPGNNMLIAALEENGATANMRRALVHARNLNSFFRLGEYVPAVAVANALEAWQQVLTWDQGRTVFTPSKAIPQPPY